MEYFTLALILIGIAFFSGALLGFLLRSLISRIFQPQDEISSVGNHEESKEVNCITCKHFLDPAPKECNYCDSKFSEYN